MRTGGQVLPVLLLSLKIELNYNISMKSETIYNLANFIADIADATAKLGLELEYIQLWLLAGEICHFAKK